MRLQVCRVDHHDLLLAPAGGQPRHDPGEDPHPAPTDPAVVERLRRPILGRGVAPPQPIAIDEDYAAQHAPVIDPRTTMALREKRPQPLNLFLGQPEQVAHHHPRKFGSLNHAGRQLSSQLMGPDPRSLSSIWILN